MIVRQGMTDLIQLLRQWGQAGVSEFTIGSDTYWTNKHLESVLDRNRTDIYRERLTVEPIYSGGSLIYQDYYFARGHVEQLTDGSQIFRLENSAGSIVGTADYTVEYEARHIQFDSNTENTVYYLSYRSYNVEMAAADVWQQKAASISESAYEISTDNHTIKRKEKLASYLQMASLWRNKALSSIGGKTSEKYLIRSDVNA